MQGMEDRSRNQEEPLRWLQYTQLQETHAIPIVEALIGAEFLRFGFAVTWHKATKQEDLG